MPPDDAAPPCATLRMPDGREISLPVLTDAAGALFVDVRKLQPDTGALLRQLHAQWLRAACVAARCPERKPRELGTEARAARAGICTFDPGFSSTAACASAVRLMRARRRRRVARAESPDDQRTHNRQVTFIDGEKGELLYRGYPIEQLAEHSDFLDCAFLLLVRQAPICTPSRPCFVR
jgi:hypothetical protein